MSLFKRKSANPDPGLVEDATATAFLSWEDQAVPQLQPQPGAAQLGVSPLGVSPQGVPLQGVQRPGGPQYLQPQYQSFQQPGLPSLAQAHLEPEAVVVRLHRHGRRLVWPVLALAAIAAASGFWVGTLPEAWMNLGAGFAAAGLAVLLGLVPILVWTGRSVTITTRRVILRRGVLVHHRTEVPLSRVREVRTKRGPMQHLFGSGDVELYVGAGAPTRLPDIPNPALISETLNELVERNYVHSTSALWPGNAGPYLR